MFSFRFSPIVLSSMMSSFVSLICLVGVEYLADLGAPHSHVFRNQTHHCGVICILYGGFGVVGRKVTGKMRVQEGV